MNSIATFNFHGKPLRVLVQGGRLWWIASEVGVILGMEGNGNRVTRPLDPDEKGVLTMDTLGGPQDVVGITESGLYSLILKSRKPEAKAFKRWVTHEVLPSIRETGQYSVGTPQQIASAVAKATGLETPSTWTQDLAHKIEQTRGCAKGTYELVKTQILPRLDALETRPSVLGNVKPSQAVSMLNAISRACSNPKALATAKRVFPDLFRDDQPAQPMLPGLEA